MITRQRLRKLRPFLLWLALFYTAWLATLAVGNHWLTAIHHWPIALAMAFGSYVAGSTPMGGGTVAFPILVLLFDQPATLGRDFSFAVQSIGMVSASIFILAVRQPLEATVLKWAMLGSAIGTPLGLLLIAPHAPGLLIKLLFAVVWASFGLMHLVRLREITSATGITPTTERFDRTLGLLIGLGAGATVASITGVGIDMVVYAILVLVARADLKIAIPTSVVLMAWTSLLGIATRLAQHHLGPHDLHIDPGVFHNWLAAAPIVALGAPVRALVVRRLSRTPTLLIVSLLCLLQFTWTLWHEREAMTPILVVASVAAVLAVNAAFHLLHRYGMRLATRRLTPPPT